ncbi:DUF607 domain-containing protein [Cephalotus follicularis]|uniref:DUF607 domain-containing protein n=1 Tax=Cephalotus follicularis TaxID=3775 RepID=A0A1Q3CK97_CEPFO|nr:DUF607 domain-containing protein [Cephalotus follicularis]
MALRRALSNRLIISYRATSSPPVTLDHSPISSPPSLVPPNASRANFHREYITSPDSGYKEFFRRFLHWRAAQSPEFLSLPVGEKLREKLRGINISSAGDSRNHLRMEGLSPPQVPASFGVTVEDVRKVLRIARVERVKAVLREIPESSIPYSEFVEVCARECGCQDQGLEFAKSLDHSGNVVVLGNVVFLNPDQVAKSMENLISRSIAMPNDTRREQLEQMEMQKASIDQKAKAQVRGELYCGLGFLVVQTLGFMRLTFWELSWDVMEPICFFVTSLHFALAYGFFLRTSTEPTFEGFFQRRFKAKQEKLMKIHSFDIDNYNELCKVFYPNGLPNLDHYSKPSNHDKRMLDNAFKRAL